MNWIVKRLKDKLLLSNKKKTTASFVFFSVMMKDIKHHPRFQTKKQKKIKIEVAPPLLPKICSNKLNPHKEQDHKTRQV